MMPSVRSPRPGWLSRPQTKTLSPDWRPPRVRLSLARAAPASWSDRADVAGARGGVLRLRLRQLGVHDRDHDALATASSISGPKASSPGWPMIAMPSGWVATASLNWVIICSRPSRTRGTRRSARRAARPPWRRCRRRLEPPPSVPPGKNTMFVPVQNLPSSWALATPPVASIAGTTRVADRVSDRSRDACWCGLLPWSILLVCSGDVECGKGAIASWAPPIVDFVDRRQPACLCVRRDRGSEEPPRLSHVADMLSTLVVVTAGQHVHAHVRERVYDPATASRWSASRGWRLGRARHHLAIRGAAATILLVPPRGTGAETAATSPARACNRVYAHVCCASNRIRT